MRKTRFFTLALAVMVTVCMSATADAGWFSKEKKEESTANKHRFEMFPTMKFFSGTLRRDSYSGWTLDDLSLQLMESGDITMEGSDEGYLKEGNPAIIMGVKYGATLVAYRVRVLKRDYGAAQWGVEEKVDPGPAPGIGIGHGPH